jgi:hypothetical protein
MIKILRLLYRSGIQLREQMSSAAFGPIKIMTVYYDMI